MPRYDKYDPYDGGFRAPLAAAIAYADKNELHAVGLDNAGRVVLDDPSTSGFVGVLVAHDQKRAGDIVDVMTDGEIVEMEGLTAGTTYYANVSTGVISATPSIFKIGHTVEATRLVVRAQALTAGA